MEEKNKLFEKISDTVDKIEIPDFALWLLLQGYRDRLQKEMKEMKVEKPYEAYTMAEMKEIDKAIGVMREDLACRLWG